MNTLSLPTAATLKELPLIERTRVFANWVATKPAEETFDYMDIGRCAIAQFVQTVTGNPLGYASGTDFHDAWTGSFPLLEKGTPAWDTLVQWNRLTTFGELAKALEETLILGWPLQGY